MATRTVTGFALITKRGALELSSEGFQIAPRKSDFNSVWYGHPNAESDLVKVTITYDDAKRYSDPN